MTDAIDRFDVNSVATELSNITMSNMTLSFLDARLLKFATIKFDRPDALNKIYKLMCTHRFDKTSSNTKPTWNPSAMAKPPPIRRIIFHCMLFCKVSQSIRCLYAFPFNLACLNQKGVE